MTELNFDYGMFPSLIGTIPTHGAPRYEPVRSMFPSLIGTIHTPDMACRDGRGHGFPSLIGTIHTLDSLLRRNIRKHVSIPHRDNPHSGNPSKSCRFSRYLAGNARVFLNFLRRIQTLCGRSLLRIPPGAVGGPESAQPHPCALDRRYRGQKYSSRASTDLLSDQTPAPILGQLS